MLIKSITLKNFRGIENMDIVFDKRLTVFVGGNGVGKTSFLDAISLALSHYVARLVGSSASAGKLAESDVRNDAAEARIAIEVSENEAVARWTLLKQGHRERVLRSKSSNYEKLTELIKKIATRQAEGDSYLSGETLIAYYNQNRAFINIPQRKRTKISHVIADAFAESLRIGNVDFRKLTFWFQERETDELRRQRGDRKYIDRQLDAVRRAITGATGLKNPYYRVERPSGLVLSKGSIELHASQLSTGERVFMALAADLARRLSIVNPNLEEPLRGHGIILIDEVELHLHPNWQRKILPWLCTTFPQCQFVVTTHSPQVIGEIDSKSIRVLTHEKGRVRLSLVSASKGRDSNFILEGILGAHERPIKSANILGNIDRAISDGRFDDARRSIIQLRKELEGAAPEITIAEARLARRMQNLKK